jgi:hypothetical protein
MGGVTVSSDVDFQSLWNRLRQGDESAANELLHCYE